MKEPKHPILAEGKVRHVGDPIAVVVAETQGAGARRRRAGRGRLSRSCPRHRHAHGASGGEPQVHEEARRTTSATTGNSARTRTRWIEAIRSAAHVTTLELVNNRLVANPMEPRCAIGDYDARARSTRSTPPRRTRM
jgi:carbon-monoxide dehydrogenase large subunit